MVCCKMQVAATHIQTYTRKKLDFWKGLFLPVIDRHRLSQKKGQKSPKNWEVTVGDTHMYTLRTREKK